MPLRIELYHIGGRYPQLLAEHLSEAGGTPVREHRLPATLPMIVDDPEEFLPEDVGGAEIVIAVNLHQDILVDLPKLLGPRGARALIAPIESPEWVRPGQVHQVTGECSKVGMESAFPKPFCALEPKTPVLQQFCEEYGVGRPQLRLQVQDGRVIGATVPQGSPCGLTHWVAERLIGRPADETLEPKAAELLHLRPCLATMVLDPALGDTVMHESIRLMEAAARQALATAERS
ncbi:MAG: hypothetical protein FJX74_12620 [Armatimonadetes bacterium]|nr:hypothetical protein [Armatimonadota bacterium]